MRIKYEAPKGHRVKKGTYKENYKYSHRSRFHILMYLECGDINGKSMWWSYDRKMWINLDNKLTHESFSNNNDEIHNLKSAIRHINKWDYIPKGTKFRLVSRFKGLDIEIIK